MLTLGRLKCAWVCEPIWVELLGLGFVIWLIRSPLGIILHFSFKKIVCKVHQILQFLFYILQDISLQHVICVSLIQEKNVQYHSRNFCRESCPMVGAFYVSENSLRKFVSLVESKKLYVIRNFRQHPILSKLLCAHFKSPSQILGVFKFQFNIQNLIQRLIRVKSIVFHLPKILHVNFAIYQLSGSSEALGLKLIYGVKNVTANQQNFPERDIEHEILSVGEIL